VRPGVLALVLLLAGDAAHAQSYPPVTDRDYAIDLFNGGAIGSVRIVSMGGTAVAVAEGSAGTLANPASAVVRRTTSLGNYAWDFHLDGLRAVYASDFDNNGITSGYATRLETAGLAGMLYGWGIAVDATQESTQFEGDSGDTLDADTLETRVAVAHEFLDKEWTAGVAARAGAFTLARGGETLFSVSGASLEAGGLWRPRDSDLRIGASASLPINGNDIAVESCDPMSCDGYILPSRVLVPWQLSAGVAWRRAPTAWNQPVHAHYRDERALLVAVDVVLTGAVSGGENLQAFGKQVMQPSGRHLSPSLRGGVEWEGLPGRLRVRGGSYWEPSRISGVGGRLHGTLGFELAMFQFHVSRWQYRPRIAFTGDIAARYGNAGVSIGFWH
jgi:hypothetical protein